MKDEDVKATIPVSEERLSVGTRVVETGTVRIEKKVSKHLETVRLQLSDESVVVDRIACDRVVEGDDPGIRQEGATTIIPVLEERLVWVKQRVLVEEVHITSVAETRNYLEEVGLHREEVEVVRSPAEPEPGEVVREDENS